jgi:hypothetical protein
VSQGRRILLFAGLVPLSVAQFRLRKLKDARASFERSLAISKAAYGPAIARSPGL